MLNFFIAAAMHLHVQNVVATTTSNGGQLFLGGEFNYNLLNDAVRMKYDGKTESYVQTVLLKQGGYNYQYWFVPKAERKASAERVDGSFWQTGNEYTVYVYHRPWGERYDKLVGVKVIQ